MARPQLATVNENPAQPPINDLELTEMERRAVLARKLHEIEELEADKKAIADDIKTVKKELVEQGFTKKAIDFALKLRGDADGKMVEQRQAEAEVARFLNSPIGFEPELPLDRTPVVDKAFAEGEIAGAQGLTCTAPYPTGAETEQGWIKGWHQGQASIMSAFQKIAVKEAAKEESASRGEQDSEEAEYDGED